MKPIEPGCLALATPPQDMALPVHTVTAVKEVDLSPLLVPKPGHAIWMIDSPLVGIALACSCCLTRIDGGPDAVLEKTDEEIPA